MEPQRTRPRSRSRIIVVRNLAFTVLASLAAMLMLQYAQSVLVPDRARRSHQLRAGSVRRRIASIAHPRAG